MSRVKLRNTNPRVRFGLEGVWLEGLRHPDSSEAWFDASVMDLDVVQTSLERGILLLVASEIDEVPEEKAPLPAPEPEPEPEVEEESDSDADLSGLTESQLKSMRKADVREIAEGLGLPTSGTKSGIIAAILLAVE